MILNQMLDTLCLYPGHHSEALQSLLAKVKTKMKPSPRIHDLLCLQEDNGVCWENDRCKQNDREEVLQIQHCLRRSWANSELQRHLELAPITQRDRASLCVDHVNTQHRAPVTYLCNGLYIVYLSSNMTLPTKR